MFMIEPKKKKKEKSRDCMLVTVLDMHGRPFHSSRSVPSETVKLVLSSVRTCRVIQLAT